MLESLTVENFLSFRDKTVFDFTATAEKPKPGFEHLEWFASSNRKKLLKVVFLFGNNGSGKSNFLHALNLLRLFVLNRKESRTAKGDELPAMQFSFDARSRTSPSTISAVMHDGKRRYTYTLSWGGNAILREQLLRQTGRKPDELVFDRTYDADRNVAVVDFPERCGLDNEAQRIIRENVIPNTTVVSVYDNKNMDAPDIAAVHRFFETSCHYFGLDDDQLNLCDLLTCRNNYGQMHDLLIQMLHCLGSNIQDYRVDTTRKRLIPELAHFLRTTLPAEEYNERFPDNMEITQYLRFAHFSNDAEANSNDPYVWLTESQESDGTLNMIRLMVVLIEAARNNTLVVIDECAMGIHQETFNRIIQFYLAISGHSQVLLATQALPVLDMDGFRRDTARFFDKDFRTGVSSVERVDLRKFHVNKNIYKNYVDHAFGGRPSIPAHDEWVARLQQLRERLGWAADEMINQPTEQR